MSKSAKPLPFLNDIEKNRPSEMSLDKWVAKQALVHFFNNSEMFYDSNASDPENPERKVNMKISRPHHFDNGMLCITHSKKNAPASPLNPVNVTIFSPQEGLELNYRTNGHDVIEASINPVAETTQKIANTYHYYRPDHLPGMWGIAPRSPGTQYIPN